MLIVPSAILTLSFPLIPFFVDVMSIFPPVITTSSLPTMPCALELILREPLPLMVRSPFEKITPSTLLSSVATKVPEVVSVLVVPSLSVTKTLSASFTYIAAVLSLVIVTPSSTS